MTNSWRAYEQQIYERIKGFAGEEAEVIFDHKLHGHLSGVDRQIDVFVRGQFANQTATGTMAVDCKCWSTRVDVADVDRFVGTIEDVRTDFGLLVTTEGFTPAAERRAASARGIRVEIVPYEELDEWEPQVEFCEFCTDWESDRPPGFIYIDPIPEELGDSDLRELVTGVGCCEHCGAVYMQCACGTVNGVSDYEHEQWQECSGGCGTEWLVSIELDRKGVPTVTSAAEMIQARRR